jgi:surface carbohydrate biosynthesis protein
MRKISCVSNKDIKKSIDVLIVDEVGCEWIQHCIPPNLNTFTLKTRGVIPIIFKPSFVLHVIKRIAKHGITPVAIMAALIDVIRPKVIISFIESRIYGPLDNIFTDVSVICVQNGARTTHPVCFGDWVKSDTLPHYFGFGDFELEFMNDLGVTINHYEPVGSLKLGLFASQYKEEAEIKNKSVCYISQYRKAMCSSDDKIMQKFVSYCREGYLLLANWANKNNCTVVVAMVNSENAHEYQHEIQFYTDIIESDSIEFVANSSEAFSSYKLGAESRACVVMDSTLGFELFGFGSKILFFGCADVEFQEEWGVVGNFRKMPQEVLLSKYEQDEFDSKMNTLLSLEQSKYEELSKVARKYYMNCTDVYPHEAIKKHIEEHCKSFQHLQT